MSVAIGTTAPEVSFSLWVANEARATAWIPAMLRRPDAFQFRHRGISSTFNRDQRRSGSPL